MSDKTKYSKDELEEFKGIINEKLEKAKEDLTLLVDQISHKDDHGTDDTSPTFKLMDEGSEVLSKEEINQLAARQQKFVESLGNALIRIQNGTYGVCRVTGKLIAKERLRIVPHATLSIEAKNAQG
ncbi:MAG: DnaK suppressor protein [Bacteroidia bacterium]|jgi:DnaK suppressor protein